MKKKYRSTRVTVIVRSCLTGVPVWIYRGPTVSAARRAYYRACNYEVERIRRWPEYCARAKAVILDNLNELLSRIPLLTELTDKQKECVRTLRQLAEEAGNEPCYMEFYNHFTEMRRRRKEGLPKINTTLIMINDKEDKHNKK